MTKQEAKVSTFFLASTTGLLLGGALTRIATMGHLEPGTYVPLLFGVVVLVISVMHVGLPED